MADKRETWAIVPLKQLDQAKTRLAIQLTRGKRRELTLAMARDVLAAVRGCQSIDHILLVCADRDTAQVLNNGEFEWFAPASPGDLNSDLQAACDYAYAQGAAAALIVHADLPLLSSAELDQLTACDSNLYLNPCKDGTGTNLLFTPLPFQPGFAYGSDSLQQHRERARRMGLQATLTNYPGAALDIDTAADLQHLSEVLADFPGRATTTRRVVTSLRPYINDRAALQLLDTGLPALMRKAARLTSLGHGQLVTYSRKVFIPLTSLCRDVCHYCTFAKTPRRVESPYMSLEQVLEVARQGAAMGCKEALFTLGEKPELRYRAAREALAEMGFSSTIDYLAHAAEAVLKETGLLPHINAGNMTEAELLRLQKLAPSMGLMLESASERLCTKGMPHYGSPDKQPAARLATLERAGRLQIPFTTGLLIGIGETRRERIESLLAIRKLHHRYGHIQEIILQNFKAKPDTRMANAPEPDLDELCWTIAVTRLLFGPAMNIQAPPNLSESDQLPRLIAAGINDWGGVSPLTPDYVNPEAPWPHLDQLTARTASCDRHLQERLTIYPSYLRDGWLDPALRPAVLALSDAEGLARDDQWLSGHSTDLPHWIPKGPMLREPVTPNIKRLLANCVNGEPLDEDGIALLFSARGNNFWSVCKAADQLRQQTVGDKVTFVVNRNINYTNICYFDCKFCAFSKGSHRSSKDKEHGRDRPYRLDLGEIVARAEEAWHNGASEVCLQGGIHPSYTGETYLEIVRAIKTALPQMHIHAFSPLEVQQGAATLGWSLERFLGELRDAGLGTLPGTAAEILDDTVRAQICPDKLNTREWCEVMETAHNVGLRSTATIMFGHVDNYRHWAKHLLTVRDIQQRTGGFTEFVPLAFVASEAPMYRRGHSRRGPTLREAILMHAVSRLALHPLITNIQTSWVKMGPAGAAFCLDAGANDLGGVLMNESITRAAGASHGQLFDQQQMQALVAPLNRPLLRRDTLYHNLTPVTDSAPLDKIHARQLY